MTIISIVHASISMKIWTLKCLYFLFFYVAWKEKEQAFCHAVPYPNDGAYNNIRKTFSKWNVTKHINMHDWRSEWRITAFLATFLPSTDTNVCKWKHVKREKCVTNFKWKTLVKLCSSVTFHGFRLMLEKQQQQEEEDERNDVARPICLFVVNFQTIWNHLRKQINAM